MRGKNPMPGLNPPLTITRAWLAQHDACEDQADLFEKLWPDGAVVTKDTLARAVRAGLSLEWLVKQVLSPAAYAAYLMERGPLDAGYMAEYVVLDAAYRATWNVMDAAHEANMNALLATYRARRDALLIAAIWAEAG